MKTSYDDFEREFNRIGADSYLRAGFASDDPRISLDLILKALRATPTGSGTPGFERTLKTMLDAQDKRGSDQ